MADDAAKTTEAVVSELILIKEAVELDGVYDTEYYIEPQAEAVLSVAVKGRV